MIEAFNIIGLIVGLVVGASAGYIVAMFMLMKREVDDLHDVICPTSWAGEEESPSDDTSINNQ